VVGTNEWLIDGNFKHAEHMFYRFTGTNLTEQFASAGSDRQRRKESKMVSCGRSRIVRGDSASASRLLCLWTETPASLASSGT
jgi:hypothetical protein